MNHEELLRNDCHPWCRNTVRDEAVRAAEDGRSGPLPTLEECIERQKHAAMKAGVVNGFFIAEGAVAMIPKSVSATSAPEPENTVNGMRTERVTLELTGRFDSPPSEWPWEAIFSQDCRVHIEPGDNVRVVDEVAFDAAWAERLTAERDAAIRERDEYRRALTVENDHALRLAAERDALKARIDYLERDRKFWSMQSAVHEQAANALKARVAELESAPAASGAANSPAVPVSSEPVAYWVQWKTDTVIDKWTFQSTFPTLKVAAEYIDEYAEEDDQPEIVPLYAAPPPARGWLTQEEREALLHVSATHGSWSNDDQPIRVIKSLLARSSPPEVVRPSLNLAASPTYVDVSQHRDAEWIAALAAAGVAVKEVGK